LVIYLNSAMMHGLTTPKFTSRKVTYSGNLCSWSCTCAPLTARQILRPALLLVCNIFPFSVAAVTTGVKHAPKPLVFHNE